MSRIEEMIRELCPEGVEYKTIQETVGVNRGKRLTKSQLSDEGKYEVYHGSKDTILGKYIEYNAPANTVIVVNTGGIGGVKFLNQPFWCSDGSFWLGHVNYVNPKFLFYYLSGYEDYFYSQKRIGGVPTIDRGVIEQFRIPVPPLAIQNEIVNILDKFTELEAKLEAELEAELEARRKQYEYYRNKLLTFNGITPPLKSEMRWLMLKDICSCGVGSKPTCIMSNNASFEYINAGTTRSGYTREFNCEGDTITTPSRGQGGIGYVGYQVKPFWLGPLCYKIRSKDPNVLTKYVFYTLVANNDKILSLKKKGGTPALNLSDLQMVAVPIPPIAEQQRIVAILDKFEKLVNDISEGLPAEIAARRQQYEYYRDKLLAFD